MLFRCASRPHIISEFLSHGTMAEKAAAIVGCRSEVSLVEAVGLVCWLLAGRLTHDSTNSCFRSSVWDKTSWDHGRGWWSPANFAPNAGQSFVRLQVGEQYTNTRSVVIFLRFNFFNLVSFLALDLAIWTAYFLYQFDTQVVTVGCWCSVFQVEANGLKLNIYINVMHLSLLSYIRRMIKIILSRSPTSEQNYQH